ncbi:S8 family serine peptidase [Paenibacillus caui]|uniref:S8 family serine peptidase n=1 Tax=Paenibacillus caui TaxID=2873927 RepID=UPI001CA8B8D4|nr:S8 family serine peptidase [Paenibacillus caui]
MLALSKSVEWIIQNKQLHNIRIVCMSFGFDESPMSENLVLEQLINKLLNNQIIVVSSAGNNGNNNGEITLPGRYSNVLAVGSINYDPRDDSTIFDSKISNFSSTKVFGENSNKPDIYAPGEHIITTSALKKRGYTVVSGTSFSAAIVTGQISIMMQKYPNKNNEEILSTMKKNLRNKIFYLNSTQK